MSKRGYLTNTEYRAIRKLLGFSIVEAKEFHKVQNVSTIKRWESGYSQVSEIACDKIISLLNTINATISMGVEEYLKSKASEIVLIVYPDSCYKKFVAGIGDLPNSVHKAMITRIYNELRKYNVDVHIVEFNPQDYFSFIGARGLSDSQDARAAWAADYYSRIIIN